MMRKAKVILPASCQVHVDRLKTLEASEFKDGPMYIEGVMLRALLNGCEVEYIPPNTPIGLGACLPLTHGAL